MTDEHIDTDDAQGGTTARTDDAAWEAIGDPSLDPRADQALEDSTGFIEHKDSVAANIEAWIGDARELSRELGLDPYDVRYWIVTNEEMDELITYNGFQRRYPHWRWGMRYERQRAETEYLSGKAFEIVNNDDPCHAFLQRSNTMADQKAVVTHVEAHADFFKNNQWFETDPDAVSRLAQNADRVEEIMDRPDVDRDDVEWLLDTARCLADTIDQQLRRRPDADDEDDVADLDEHIESLDIEESLKDRIFDAEWIEEHADGNGDPSFHEDVLGFILENGQRYDGDNGRAVEFEDWEREILSIVHEEAYYFAPQKMTKIMNEGWACVAPDTRVATEDGLLRMDDVVDSEPSVSDGSTVRDVLGSNVIEDHDTVTIETNRGFTLRGSDNHRIRRPDGSWVELGDLSVGDRVEIVGGTDVWSDEHVDIEWTNPESETTLDDVAEYGGFSRSAVYEYRNDGSISPKMESRVESAIEATGWTPGRDVSSQRTDISVPDLVDDRLAIWLGLFIADGFVESRGKCLGFTNGDAVTAELFESLTDDLFGISPSVREYESHYEMKIGSKNLATFVVDVFGVPSGAGSSKKEVPECIFQSPKPVVASFLRGLFEGDGHAISSTGVFYTSTSDELIEQVQCLCTNFGIWTTANDKSDGTRLLQITGHSARRFRNDIGFITERKSESLRSYVEDREWFHDEDWSDEIVDIETGTGDVYDITVDTTHRYEAAGFVNHNSKWETIMMADEGFAEIDELVEYSDHHSKVLAAPGMNPYRIGHEIWSSIENRTNRRDVVRRLLATEGITPGNFHRTVDFDRVQSLLTHPEAYSPAVRNYSLVRRENQGFIRSITREELTEINRFVFETDRYETIEDAIADVNYSAGWDRMMDIRATHVDSTFIGEFIDEDFIRENDYFTYDYNPSTDQTQVSSVDPDDVKKKLLLQTTNMGKPTIVVEDDNFRNEGQLLLTHKYNGISLDMEQAKDLLERLFHIWGRPVNLKTIVKTSEAEESMDRRNLVVGQLDRDVTTEEQGLLIHYDGVEFYEMELEGEKVAYIEADEIDYETRPAEWL